ncbi:MAG: ribosome biogenesis GTP-binding protein YihA/YsxC [Bacilli bacterium]|jgi:GTP-binding protein|nr:ribosome biogenesis GTP-binding protein YihA/YsxC [Bacilli bacterium]HHU24604.1 YihA family ribosome biogenesis GTP-binding protein [Acholeplasmataceae bacterium]
MIIQSAIYFISAVDSAQYPQHEGIEFVFLGRSNVGKSSLINAICNRKKLAYTSSIPGKTVALNFYHINNHFMFVDVPGYGFAKRGLEERIKFGKMIEEYLHKRSQLRLAFLVVDSRITPTEDDFLMLNYLRHYNIPTLVVATKQDKLKSSMIAKQKKIIKETLRITDEELLFVSSETKKGIESIHKTIETVLNQ